MSINQNKRLGRLTERGGECVSLHHHSLKSKFFIRRGSLVFSFKTHLSQHQRDELLK
jgi:hypothetical protein